MFDQRKAIERWRARLAETGALFEADLDELESHLHDHLEALEELGITGEEAFRTATERLGETRSLADEFAKVNPLLAWRAALFWITTGVVIVLAGYPLHELAEHAAIMSAMALHLGKTATTLLMWAVSFAEPLVFFTILFPVARRGIDAPLPWARSAILRVGFVVACAVLMLVSHLLVGWGWFYWIERRWSGPMLDHAYTSSMHATYALAVAAPVFLFVTAARQRALAMENRAESAPLFWLAIGVFIGALRWELHTFVRCAAVTVGSIAKLQPAQMNALMWIVSLACPAVLFLSTYAYLRHRAPGPSSVLRAPLVLVAMAASAAVAIGAVFATMPVMRYGTTTREVAAAAHDAWLFAGIVTSCLLPVVLCTIMLRLLRAGTHVRRAESSLTAS